MNKNQLVDEVRFERQLSEVQNQSDKWEAKYKIVSKELHAATHRANHLADICRVPRERSYSKLQSSGEGTAIFVLSDIHCEESVDGKTINGLNSFDLTICQQRVESCFKRFLFMADTARHMCKIDTLVLAVLGDLITGHIHEELQEGNNLSPTEATLFISDLLVNGIRFLKTEGGFKNIIVPTCYGNHGRVSETKKVALAYANSYEWLMYKTLEKYTQIPGVTWKVENGYFNWLNVAGFDVRFHHGDHIKYSGGVGGITVPVNKALSQWNKIKVADYDYFGHYHQSINMNRWCCNGSVIGYNAYALSIKAEYEVPSQTISIISKKRGKIFTDKVFCD
jgi:hypothetical protein